MKQDHFLNVALSLILFNVTARWRWEYVKLNTCKQVRFQLLPTDICRLVLRHYILFLALLNFILYFLSSELLKLFPAFTTLILASIWIWTYMSFHRLSPLETLGVKLVIVHLVKLTFSHGFIPILVSSDFEYSRESHGVVCRENVRLNDLRSLYLQNHRIL